MLNGGIRQRKNDEQVYTRKGWIWVLTYGT